MEGIIAQRLVRKVCSNCQEQVEYDRNLVDLIGAKDYDLGNNLYVGKGCEKCHETGYLGRVGLFEVFQMNEEFRYYLTTKYKESELLHMAKTMGMETLLEDGLNKVKQGLTTLEELVRVLGPAIQFEHSCSKCNKNLDIKYISCPHCGTPQKQICGHCKSNLNIDWVVCPYCGK